MSIIIGEANTIKTQQQINDSMLYCDRDIELPLQQRKETKLHKNFISISRWWAVKIPWGWKQNTLPKIYMNVEVPRCLGISYAIKSAMWFMSCLECGYHGGWAVGSSLESSVFFSIIPAFFQLISLDRVEEGTAFEKKNLEGLSSTWYIAYILVSSS